MEQPGGASQQAGEAEGIQATQSAERAGGAASGPTVLRRLLGSQLRRLREASGITREAAGHLIRGSESKISRMELGRVSFKERDVADLLTLYGVTDPEERAALLALTRQANEPGWWYRYSDLIPNWFTVYLGLEQAASLLRIYEIQYVTGLLQTEDYARAVMVGSAKLRAGASPQETERRVAFRMERQRMLDRPNPPRLWVVEDELALRRPIGGREVLRGQLKALIDACDRPNVTIQVLPFHVGWHDGKSGAFIILRFPEPEIPDLVYTEQLTSSLYLDKQEDLDAYTAAFASLTVTCPPPKYTPAILRQILKET
jgi:transcriptional regulator with XRE-family HTH domain